MTKKNLKLKTSLSLVEKVSMTKELVNYYFSTTASHTTEFTPYFQEIGSLVTFFKYCIEGLEFTEEELKNGIYALILDDPELMDLYQTRADLLSDEVCFQLNEIQSNVKEIVDFEKQRQIRKLETDYRILELIKYAYTAIEKFEKKVSDTSDQLLELTKNLDPDKISQAANDTIKLFNSLDSEKLEYLKQAMTLNTSPSDLPAQKESA